MNAKWRKLAGAMLNLAADQFANHGCNDWSWPDDWTKQERRGFAEAMVRLNHGRREGRFSHAQREEVEWITEHAAPDWWVMRALARWLERGG